MEEFIHQSIDNTVLQWLQECHTKFLNQNMLNITALGSSTVLFLVSLITLGWLVKCREWYTTAIMLTAVAMALLFVETVKYQVERERPVVTNPVILRPHSPSFPSGHSSMSMCVLSIIAIISRRRYFVMMAVLLSLVIGFSRMYLGVHWCSDVLCGWLIGATFAWVFFHFYRKKSR